MEEPLEALMLALLLLAAVLVSSVIDQLVPKISSPLIQILLGLGIALLASSQIKIELDVYKRQLLASERGHVAPADDDGAARRLVDGGQAVQ